MVPKKLRAGRSYDVSVQILQAGEPVEVTAKLQSGEATVVEDTAEFLKGEFVFSVFHQKLTCSKVLYLQPRECSLALFNFE